MTLRAIHAMRRELGLDEDAYRGLLVRVTGKASLRAMTTQEQNRVVADMRAKGGGAKKRLDGDFGPKLQALWISGWNLGVVRNRDDAALLAFVKGQTGIDHTRFLRDAKDARKTVEALKKWLARDAGVDWSEFEDAQDCVIAAQCRLLRQTPGDIGFSISGSPDPAATKAIGAVAKLALMQLMGERIRAGQTGA